MKNVLRLNLYMDLPDDFDGSLSDALGLFLALREADSPLPLARDVSVRVSPESFSLNGRYGASVCAEEGIWQLSGRKWTNLLEPPLNAVIDQDVWVK